MTMANVNDFPLVGIGTWKINDKQLMEILLKNAFDIGYRLIDTAASYSNEMIIGRAIKNVGLPRNELNISDKVWRTNYGYEATKEACKKSLKKLKIDYLNLYLIHWPASPHEYPDWEEINAETWRAMEHLKREGLVQSIGVSNFKPYHLESLKKTASEMPIINQIEFHIGMTQPDVFKYCENNNMINSPKVFYRAYTHM